MDFKTIELKNITSTKYILSRKKSKFPKIFLIISLFQNKYINCY
jgi:hypothetical protein